MGQKHVFVFNVVGLSPEYLEDLHDLPALSNLAASGRWLPMEPVFPGLTLPCQASLLTGLEPAQHGVVANGFYYRDRLEISFWDQYSSLIQGECIWDSIKKKNPDLKTALLFWQNSLYADASIVMTPRPIHLEDGMVQWCYSKPVGFYEKVAAEIGPFNLMNYWGPMASSKSSEWIMKCARTVLRDSRPDLMLVYLPHMDYSSQRFGPGDPKVREDLKTADRLLGEFMQQIKEMGIEKDSTIVVLSEYSFSEVNEAVPLNLILRDEGLLKVREIGGVEYPDMEMSEAFAMVDHQIAHIYIQRGIENIVRDILMENKGVDLVLDREEQQKYGINHERAGELIAISRPDSWFSYYWWKAEEKAPKFAFTVDIHRKPGYDPLELFFDPQKKAIPTNTSLVKGSHGYPANGKSRMAVFMASGRNMEKLAGLDKIYMTDAKGIIESLLLE